MTTSASKDLVSVLLPVGPKSLANERGRSWLQESLNSLLQQSHQALEILMIGPDKNCDADLSELKLPDDSRIRLLQRPSPGIVTALNTGIDAARGNWIARMDADDLAHPTRIERQLGYLRKNTQIDLCSCDVEIFSDDGPIQRGNLEYMRWLNGLTQSKEIAASLLIESPCPHPTWLMKQSLCQQLFGYRDSNWAEDYDFLLRAHQSGALMGKPPSTNTPLLRWRDHDNRLTRQSERYSRGNFIAAKAWAMTHTCLKGRSAVIIGTGRNAKLMYDALNTQGITVDYFVDLHTDVKNRSLRRTEIIDYKSIAERIHGDALLISVVTRYGARTKLKHWFDENDFVEERDFVFAG